jgi:ribosome-binding factor A
VAKSSGPSQRHQRIEAEMLRALAELIRREVKDPRVGLVTVTAVRAAQDLSHAQVFVLPFGSGDADTGMLDGLAHAAGFLRGEVGRRVGLRHAPKLSFVFDDSYDRAVRLTSLISDAVKSDGRPDGLPDGNGPDRP